MSSSIDNATILAYKKANKEIKITNNVNNVIYIDDLAKTDVQVYDQIISVDKNNISDINDLKEYIRTKKENDIVTDGSRAITKFHVSDVVMVVILVILCATCVVPFIHLLAKSVSSNTAVLA